MPLPWKKAKVTRISRIVADLQPTKRGGSLVVETGFPTSLIDLFVKNRDRLKRPSIKKTKTKTQTKKKNDTNENDDTQRVDSVNDLRVADSDPTPAESNSSELEAEDFKAEENSRNSSSSESSNAGTSELVEMRQSTTTTATREHEEEEAPDVFMAVVKVFAVAVLALSTKKLAVGITLSAFALLFLEFVAKRLVVRFAGDFRWIREQSTEPESESDEEFVAPPRERPSPAKEIKALETRSSIKDEEVFLRPVLEQLSRDKKWGFLDAKEVVTESGDQVSALEKSKSKRAKIRRKIIKNFVPKKLRSVSKKMKNSNSNSNSNLDRLETKIEEQEQGEEFEDVEDEVTGLSILSEEEEEEEEEEGEKKEEGEDQEKEVKWLLVIIFGAILLGLCWGRIFAVSLTVVWCVVMKLIGIIGSNERNSSLTEAC